jgi:hypothetical protein
VDVSTGRRSAESATPAASAAASRVVHRDSYVCPAKNSRGRQNRAVIGAGKTAHGWREREKHLIFPQAVKPCPSTKRERVPGTTRNLNVQQPPEIEARIEDSTARGCPPLSVAVRGTRTRVSAPHGGE